MDLESKFLESSLHSEDVDLKNSQLIFVAVMTASSFVGIPSLFTIISYLQYTAFKKRCSICY